MISVISHRKMVVDELSNLKNYKYIINNNNCNDEYIITHNYKKIDILITETNSTFILYHGFPGNNPDGIAYNVNDFDFVCVGENCKNENLTKNGLIILDWYNKLTNDCCDYDNEILE